jgi:outer membrane protein assembly factor BamB
MYEGGENGIFYAIKLNRHHDINGNAAVDPKIIFSYQTYNHDLIKSVGNNLSIENSTLISKDRAYIANSGGRILGFDISNIENGVAPVVFDYFVGDDIDATLLADDEGMIYVTVELERFNERALLLGQFIKLDPSKEDPYVWGIKLLPKEKNMPGGAWATPAMFGDYIYLPTHNGELLTIKKNTGEITSREDVGFHAWSSPNIVDGELIIGICSKPELRSYSLFDPSKPILKWKKKIGGGCIESTPTIWKGNIYLSNRDGYFYGISESE